MCFNEVSEDTAPRRHWNNGCGSLAWVSLSWVTFIPKVLLNCLYHGGPISMLCVIQTILHLKFFKTNFCWITPFFFFWHIYVLFSLNSGKILMRLPSLSQIILGLKVLVFFAWSWFIFGAALVTVLGRLGTPWRFRELE